MHIYDRARCGTDHKVAAALKDSARFVHVVRLHLFAANAPLRQTHTNMNDVTPRNAHTHTQRSKQPLRLMFHCRRRPPRRSPAFVRTTYSRSDGRGAI